MSTSTRERMVAGAADLISRRGVRATTLRDVVRYTDTPRGSLAHHFPGGKQEMLEAALAYASDAVAAPLTELLMNKGAIGGLRAFVGWWRRVLEKSSFEAGCPILAIAVEPGPSPSEEGQNLATERLRELASQAFNRWQSILSDSLCREGVAPARAQRISVTVVAAIEGTVAMCRAEKGCRSLDEVLLELERMIKSAIADSQAD